MSAGQKTGSLLSVTGLLGASLAVHSAILFSLEPLGRLNEAAMAELQQKARLEKKEKLEFEYVEAPPKAHPQAPTQSAKKISDRDALSQDLVKNKAAAEELPGIKELGPSDQLMQKQKAPSQPAVPPSEPRPEIKPSEIKPEVPGEGLLSPKAPEDKPQEVPPKPGLKPQAPMEGLTGEDKITTQEMAKAKSRGASLYGFTSFEATGSGMGEYMKNMKERIWLAWYPYLAFHYPQDYRGASVLLSVVLNKEGQVKIVRVIESRGSDIFAAYCMEAMQRASGFGPVPEEALAIIGKDELEIRFGFHYL